MKNENNLDRDFRELKARIDKETDNLILKRFILFLIRDSNINLRGYVYAERYTGVYSNKAEKINLLRIYNSISIHLNNLETKFMQDGDY